MTAAAAFLWSDLMNSTLVAQGCAALESFLMKQGDLRATNLALTLAQNYANVALELSALGRPTVLNERGEMAMTLKLQLINVLAEAKKRNLSDKLIWASDGPPSPCFAASYRDRIVAELKQQGYSKDQIKAIPAGNFYRIFGVLSSGRRHRIGPLHHLPGAVVLQGREGRSGSSGVRPGWSRLRPMPPDSATAQGLLSLGLGPDERA